MDNIHIDYEERKGRFVVHAPPWQVELCRAMPNRRWRAADRAWTAPAIRANADYIKKSLTILGHKITPKARDKIDELLQRERDLHLTDNFPKDYRFKTTPFKHQYAALDKLYGLRTIALFMDMGTGKSKVAIDLHAAMSREYKVDTVLLLCPLSIRRNWAEQELPRHMTSAWSAHLLDTSKSGIKHYDEWMKDALGQRWLIVGIESLGSSKRAEEICKQYLCSSIHTATIVDESSKIKNHTANRAMRAVSFGRMSEYRTIMTGTPIANGPMDMFMQFEFLDPDIIGLGDFYSFRNRYAIMGGYDNKEIIGYRNLDELTEIVAPFVYQVRKKDALDLPPKLYVTREVELTDEQRRLYGTMKRGRIVATGDKSHIVENVLEKMLRLQEIAGGFVSYADAGAAKGKKTKRERIDKVLSKVTELLAIAEEAEGQSVIVWCAFKDEIYACVAALCNVYGRAAVVEIHGDIDEKQRNINKDLFQSGKARFLVGNAATGGLGLDMTAGSIEVYYSNTFNYIDRQQSEDRAHRIGQTKQVTIIDLVARGTVDAVIIEALRQKQNLSEYVRRSIARADTDHLYGETE